MFEKAHSPSDCLTITARASGLDRLAEIRAIHWEDDGKALHQFMAHMRDIRDTQYEVNRRALAAIFWLANIPASRHDATPDTLTLEERKALIAAMNRFRAMVSLFPKRLTMPL
jgi:hypothetical protein